MIEKANVFHAHKKGDKQILKSYRPTFLLPIVEIIFEKILHNNLLEFFRENGLTSHNQSVFKRGDSCIKQLISITHDLCRSFDDGLVFRGLCLDVSKAFDKV